MAQPDVRADLLSDEQFDYNCRHYAEWAFYMPPDRFLFHHYDEPADKLLICARPMVGIEKYIVNDKNGGFYGLYDTRDVTKFLKTGTWIEVEDDAFFIRNDIASLKQRLEEKKAELEQVNKCKLDTDKDSGD